MRPEVFLRFYAFHLRHRSHPGAVYYVIPFLRDTFGWDDDAAWWFAFLNGCTQHPPTSLVLHRRLAPGADGGSWFWRHVDALPVDTDRRHHRRLIPTAIAGYRALLGGAPAAEWWGNRAAAGGWAACWAAARSIPTFGRLSAWSFLEYLTILGLDIDAPSLMVTDPGSGSHRNGLAVVAGRADLDCHAANPSWRGAYRPADFAFLDGWGEALLAESRRRAVGEPYAGDVRRLTLESALCTYKSWHRPRRRYPGVYNDLLHDRIRAVERFWPADDFSPLWAARAASLPRFLRQEDSPGDPGCVPVKQDHYRLTGEVIVMGHEDPVFWSSFDQRVVDGGPW